MKSLEGRAAIVTGSAQGIGRGIAEVLGREGASIVVADINGELAEATAAEMGSAGIEAVGIKVDVTDTDSLDGLVQATVDRFGSVDILAANAGIYPADPIEEIDRASWDRVMNLNVAGAFFSFQACLPRMREQGYGRAVITSSITGAFTGHPGYSHYGASKAAVLGFMRSAAIETAKQGVTINAVLPGNVQTPGLDDAGEEHKREMMGSIPMGEFASPDDIGWAVRFLASEEAGYITGQTLVVDGGQLLPETPMALH
ncbi:MAG: 3-oxoacyl-ACP reductase FabG [Solirubrobacterales bacterium]|nr:3-oxoacyl-ACP reductase FabG [Solirubrobacterales bacterium]